MIDCQKLQEIILSTNLGASATDDIRHRSFVTATLLSDCYLEQARNEMNQQQRVSFLELGKAWTDDQKLHSYLLTRQQAEQVRRLRKSISASSGNVQLNADQLWSRILRSDFEAALQLSVWDSLYKIVDDVKQQDATHSLIQLADMLLASEAPRNGRQSCVSY